MDYFFFSRCTQSWLRFHARGVVGSASGRQALPVDDPAMDDLQDDDALGAVLEEVRHLLLELGLHLVLGDHLQVVPGCLAAALHLGQGLLQLVEVHLVGDGGGGGVKILDDIPRWGS